MESSTGRLQTFYETGGVLFRYIPAKGTTCRQVTKSENGIYFITFAVIEWVDVFTRKDYANLVVESLQYCQKEKGLIIYAWCILSNHVHLIVSATEGFALSAILRDFKKFTSASILKAIEQNPQESQRNWML